MALAIAVDGVVEQSPEQRRLRQDLAGPLGLLANLGLVGPHHLGHAAVLDEGREAVLPAEAFQARGEGGRVADQDDDVHAETLGEPFGREQRDRVLHQWPPPRTAAAAKASVVARDPDNVAPALRGPQLGSEVVSES
jgi:hypothetical protein